MSAAQHFRKLERLYAGARTNEYFGAKVSIGPGRAEVVIAVRDDFFHAAGAVHGSTFFKALDDAAYFAANSLVEDVLLLTASFHVHFLRPVSSGELRAVGTVLNASRQLILAESSIVRADGKLIAHGTGTFMRSDMPLNAAVGYA